jgi:ubiquinone/menaquinone biosynthesis C-methylase UbiE
MVMLEEKSAGLTPEYWHEVGQELRSYPVNSAWRTYCDTLNRRWLQKRLPEHCTAALKTDLFDEAVDRGVHSLLEADADQVYGIDVAGPVCGLAVERFPTLRAVASDVRFLPFEDGTFGVIVSLSTLDHFPAVVDIEQALKSIYRALHANGSLLITLDNLDNPAVRLRNAIPWRILRRSGLVPYQVGATLRSDQLRKALENAGFEVQEVGTLMHVPRTLGVKMARLLERWLGAKAAAVFCRWALPLEFLAKLPTARWTGYFTAVKAIKPGG